MTEKKTSNEEQLNMFEVAFKDAEKELTAKYKRLLYHLDLEKQYLSESTGNWMDTIEDRNDRNNQRFNDDDIEIRRQKYNKEYERELKKLKADIIPEQITKR
ncbi:MAG: hypothetical protein MJ165_01375 [Alphaproteobacteria bacterium]|nr:hypothetical protein [Alphaproteobacteria bacterium]